MTVLVTGGAGFIGTRLVEALLARGERVRLYDLKAGEARRLADLGAELLTGDILDEGGAQSSTGWMQECLPSGGPSKHVGARPGRLPQGQRGRHQKRLGERARGGRRAGRAYQLSGDHR